MRIFPCGPPLSALSCSLPKAALSRAISGPFHGSPSDRFRYAALNAEKYPSTFMMRLPRYRFFNMKAANA